MTFAPNQRLRVYYIHRDNRKIPPAQAAFLSVHDGRLSVIVHTLCRDDSLLARRRISPKQEPIRGRLLCGETHAF